MLRRERSSIQRNKALAQPWAKKGGFEAKSAPTVQCTRQKRVFVDISEDEMEDNELEDDVDLVIISGTDRALS